MKKNNEELTLSSTKTQALELGKTHRDRLNQLINRLSISSDEDIYPHLYIYSPSGLGKTFNLRQFLKSQDQLYYEVTGNVSMFAFGIQLAVIQYHNQEKNKLILFVDDTDVLFSTEISCNTMKNVLSGAKSFCYNKSLASQRGNLSETQKDSINYFNNDGKMGFSVPTDNIVFVFASNFKLPIDDEVRLAYERGQRKSVLLAHKNAIRSRCRVADFDITGAAQWGWIADVALNTNCLVKYGFEESEKNKILDFMWIYWIRLKERSIRLLEKMAVTMKECPMEYEKYWEIDHLQNN